MPANELIQKGALRSDRGWNMCAAVNLHLAKRWWDISKTKGLSKKHINIPPKRLVWEYQSGVVNRNEGKGVKESIPTVTKLLLESLIAWNVMHISYIC